MAEKLDHRAFHDGHLEGEVGGAGVLEDGDGFLDVVAAVRVQAPGADLVAEGFFGHFVAVDDEDAVWGGDGEVLHGGWAGGD